MVISNSVREKWSEILMGDMTPFQIALGVAIGTLVALLPTFGFSVFLAVTMLVFFPHINRPGVFIALAVWNPIVQIPVYAMSFELGSMLYENAPVINYKFEILSQVYSFTRRFLVGHLLITFACTALAFSITYVLAFVYQKQADFRDLLKS